jgi:hypothetical protein
MPLVDMRSPVWPHVRANHPAPCADHPRAERAHRRLVSATRAYRLALEVDSCKLAYVDL